MLDEKNLECATLMTIGMRLRGNVAEYDQKCFQEI